MFCFFYSVGNLIASKGNLIVLVGNFNYSLGGNFIYFKLAIYCFGWFRGLLPLDFLCADGGGVLLLGGTAAVG